MNARPMIEDPLGGRSLPEWIGASPDAKVPQRVIDRIWLRHRGRCHLSGRKIMPGDKWQVEHIKPLSMGGEHRETNLAPALDIPHKEKTAQEASARAKADRIRRKANGTWPKPQGNAKLQSRGFAKRGELWGSGRSKGD